MTIKQVKELVSPEIRGQIQDWQDANEYPDSEEVTCKSKSDLELWVSQVLDQDE